MIEKPYIRDGTLLTPIDWEFLREHENWYAYDGHVRMVMGDDEIVMHIYVLPN